MNDGVVDDEITVSSGLIVGIGCTVNFNSWHEQLKLCCRQMLKYASSVLHPRVLPLPSGGLFEQSVYSIGNAPRRISGKPEGLACKVCSDALDPVVLNCMKINGPV